MDMQKTGKFLQELRKEKGITQKDLATKINVSDKTVSKWENGNGFPDVVSLNALSAFYQVSLNELLAGERIMKEEYQKKAEETIVGLLKDEQKNKKKGWFLEVFGGLLLLTGILYAFIETQGITFMKSLSIWIDGGTFVSLLFIYMAMAVLFWVKCKWNLWDRLIKIVLPVGMIMSLMHLIDIFLTGIWDVGMFVQAAYSLMPMLYAAVVHVMLFVFILNEK